MQKCESRTKRVMSAIIAGMMALQVVAPTISYADDTVASTASSEDNSDTQIDPGVPVQTDTASSNTVTKRRPGKPTISIVGFPGLRLVIETPNKQRGISFMDGLFG